MTDIPVAILHGIGKNDARFADPLIRGVQKEFTARIRKRAGAEAAAEARLTFTPIDWDDILAENQAKLKALIERTQQQKKRRSFLGVLAGAGIVPIAIGIWLSWKIFRHPAAALVLLFAAAYLFYYFGPRLYNQLRSGVAAEYVGDIIGYLNEEAKEKIQARIKAKVVPLAAGGRPVTFIAHSLGTVIASDFIWDCQEHGLIKPFALGNFFTMGSPLALFALQYGVELFNKPIRVEAPACWVNILDADDPIAYPLKSLNKEYAGAVLADQEVNVGPLGLAHIRYWNARSVHTLIAHKLALDWLRADSRLAQHTLDTLNRRYAARLS